MREPQNEVKSLKTRRQNEAVEKLGGVLTYMGFEREDGVELGPPRVLSLRMEGVRGEIWCRVDRRWGRKGNGFLGLEAGFNWGEG